MQPPNTEQNDLDQKIEDLTTQFAEVLRGVLERDAEASARDYEHLLGRADNLIERKREMQGTKSETRDLLAEILFSRLRKSFRSFLRSAGPEQEIRAAEWVLGSVIGTTTLGEFASVLDSCILKASGPQDYSFAGRADFIAIEEVLQMIGSGKHTGCVSLEKPDNRLDIYIHRGQIALLDPHHLVRRVLPGANQMAYREITAERLEEAERHHARDGVPVVIGLAESGEFKDFDKRALMRQLGSEVLFDFLRQQEVSYFSYRRLDELPDFVRKYELRMGITPVLLEVSKKLDDWRSMARVFPDSKASVEPMPDMLARIAGLNLGVLDIKLLTMIDGENTPESLTALIGLPLFDVYQQLVNLAREGAIVAPGGTESLMDLADSVEDSMKVAFEALDANDDQIALSSALDKVLGGDDEDEEGGGVLGSKLSLDILNPTED